MDPIKIIEAVCKDLGYSSKTYNDELLVYLGKNDPPAGFSINGSKLEMRCGLLLEIGDPNFVDNLSKLLKRCSKHTICPKKPCEL